MFSRTPGYLAEVKAVRYDGAANNFSIIFTYGNIVANQWAWCLNGLWFVIDGVSTIVEIVYTLVTHALFLDSCLRLLLSLL